MQEIPALAAHPPALGSLADVDPREGLLRVIIFTSTVMVAPLDGGGVLSWRGEGLAEGGQGLLDDAVVGPFPSLLAGE